MIKTFSESNHLKFAKFSGDFNPIHLDSVIAKKSLFGKRIVHGVHAVLWCLEELAKRNVILSSIEAIFLKPIGVGQTVCASYDDKKNTILIRSIDKSITYVQLHIGPTKLIKQVKGNLIKPKFKSSPNPEDNTIEFLKKLPTRKIDYFGEQQSGNELFPEIFKIYGSDCIVQIASCSFIVGMWFPGLYSLFSRLIIDLNPHIMGNGLVTVTRLISGVNLLHLEYQDSEISAKLQAYVRPRSESEVELKDIKEIIEDNTKFKDINALIIGGSRGLGAVISKIIAVGGGAVDITYIDCEEDAVQLKNVLQKYSKNTKHIKFSIEWIDHKIIEYEKYNQIYYFASPKILSSPNQDDLNNYKKYYVTKFENLVREAIAVGFKGAMYYPSTVLIEEGETLFYEYASMKLKGEILCNELRLKYPIKILSERLPRLSTDQNLSIIHAKKLDKIETASLLYKTICKMNDLLF